MRTNTILAALASFTVIAAANAGDAFTWVGAGDIIGHADWNRPNNWSPSDKGYPGEDTGDSVTIPDVSDASGVNPVLNVSPANALSSLTIEDDGFLTIGSTYTLDVSGTNGAVNVQASGVLDVVGTFIVSGSAGLDLDPTNSDACPIDVQAGGILRISGGGTHTIDETICLSTSTSLLDITSDATFSGSGMVDGQHDDAKIKIAAGTTFTIASGTPDFTLQGSMKIEGLTGKGNPGTLDNDGLVHANDPSGTIHLMANTRLNGSSGEFKASAFDTAVLQFSRAHPQSGPNCVLSAAFTVDDCATLDIDADQRTSGNFTCGANGGTVDDASDTFELRYGTCTGAGLVADGCGDCS